MHLLILIGKKYTGKSINSLSCIVCITCFNKFIHYLKINNILIISNDIHKCQREPSVIICNSLPISFFFIKDIYCRHIYSETKANLTATGILLPVRKKLYVDQTRIAQEKEETLGWFQNCRHKTIEPIRMFGFHWN